MKRHPNSPQGRLGLALGPARASEPLWEMTPTVSELSRGWILRGPKGQRGVLWISSEATAEAVRSLLDRRESSE